MTPKGGSSEPSITARGTQIFVATLGMVLSEFKRIDLKDRGTEWILGSLQDELHNASRFQDPPMSERDLSTLHLLMGKLIESVQIWDLSDFPDRE